MSAYPKQTDLGWRRRLRSRVLRWYDQHGRKLPWRQSADPYRIWISEIMLQQTTVAAVVPYFERFLKRFPTVEDLAKADQQDVLKQWEGLGYYSRARNLHKAAGVIVDELGGRFPESADDLKLLPGVGPYTAGAIASFAFNQPAAIVEANTLRLYSRLIELDVDPRGTAGQKLLWKFAGWAVSRKRAADFNQAVMDIGAEICRPENPDCPHCPLMASCKTFEAGRQHEIPLQKPKVEKTDVVEVSLAVRRRGQFLLRQRREGERWAGLWEFVRFEIDERTAESLEPAPKKRSTRPGRQQQLFAAEPDRPLLPIRIADQVTQECGVQVSSYEPMAEIRHVVTRFKIRLLCLQANADGGRLVSASGYRWFSRNDMVQLPLSTTARRFAELLLE